MTGQHAAPAISPPAADPLAAVVARFDHVRATGRVLPSITRVECSECGPLFSERGQGVVTHAVAHPGHIVTATTVSTVIYQDKQEGPINAATE